MVTPAWKDLCRLALAGGALLALACGHTDPFSVPPYGTTEPLDPTPPVRLTRNPGPDREGSWLADGSGILYSSQQTGRPDRDVCLADLPPTGGSQRSLVCDLSALGGDTINSIDYPVGAEDGRLAFLKAGNPTNVSAPVIEAVTVSPDLDPRAGTEVVRTPYTVAGEPTHNTITHLRWLSPSQLAFVGSLRSYQNACKLPCTRQDTIVTGLKVGVLDLSAPGSLPVLIPGTDYASGVALGASPGEIYYTLGGDTRAYRRVLATGEVSVLYDFGAAGIARDVHAVGNRFTAIVGGHVIFAVDTLFGPVQWDSGGLIHVVDLSTGTDKLVAGPGLFRHPALAPNGDRVVAEIPVNIPPSETTSDLPGEVFLFTVP